MVESLNIYGGDFISYIIIGSIGWGYLWNALNASSNAVNNEISMGTFESIFLTPTSPLFIIITYTIMGLIILIYLVNYGENLFLIIWMNIL